MFKHEASPPPLQYSPSPTDHLPTRSRDDTPVTPVSLGFPSEKPITVDRDLPWFRKPIEVGRATTHLSIGNSLLDPDFDDLKYPLFGASSPGSGMATITDAANSARHTSTSPRGNQPSNLTSALRRGEGGEETHMNGFTAPAAKPAPMPSEHSQNSNTDAGTRPISVKGKTNDRNNRRESVAQSLGMGMSWGGISVGSWIRDE